MAEGWKSSGYFSGVGIPAPTGVYNVGCADLMVELEGDPLGGLLVNLFYPTGGSPRVGCAEGYSYTPWLPSKDYLKGYLVFNKNKFSGILSTVLSAIIYPMMPALKDAPLLTLETQGSKATPTSPPTFPVIVFSHGLGAMRTTYSAITCDLASHGYVVAAVEHRDQSACVSHRRVPGPDGELQDQWLQYRPLEPGEDEFSLRNKQVKQRADEVGKTLDVLGLLNEGAQVKDLLGSGYDFGQFKGRLDLSKVGVAGHSFGGATSILTLQEDSRFKCGVALDCWMLPLYREVKDSIGSSLSQPFYFINSFAFQWKNNVLKMMSLCQSPDTSGRTPRRVLTLDRTDHMHQSDVLFVAPRSLQWLGIAQSGLDPGVAHRVNMDICHAFFKRHLLQDPEYEVPVPMLDGGDGHSPVIIFGTNLDLGDNKTEDQSSDGGGGLEKDANQAGQTNEIDNAANKL